MKGFSWKEFSNLNEGVLALMAKFKHNAPVPRYGGNMTDEVYKLKDGVHRSKPRRGGKRIISLLAS
jgi:hypothetical protein